MNNADFFAALWLDYVALAPQASAIRDQFGGYALINDHVAFRTFDHPAIHLTVLEQPLLELGYRRDAHYQFPDKHLSAWGYVPQDARDPLIFLSQLHIDQLDPAAQLIIGELLADMAAHVVDGPDVFFSGRHWPAPTWAQYQSLAQSSEYAAWLAIHGFHANHFTIAVHQLGISLETLVQQLIERGYAMNTSGGLIKGSEAELLKQAATLAQHIQVDFADQSQVIPGCYYEFSERFCDAQGQLYQGFVAASANRIFESTHRAT
jgi:hypothetical protein